MAYDRRSGVWALACSFGAAILALALTTSALAAPALGPGVTPDAVTVALRTRAESGAPSALRRFYAARDFRPAWLGNPAADGAVAALQSAGADGLDPSRYHGPSLAARQRLETPAEAAAYDLTLTEGLLRYANDLRRGAVDPAKVDKMVGILRPGFDAEVTLSAALADGHVAAWLASLPPAEPEYGRLKAALARYREIVAQGGWGTVPDVRKIKLEPGNPDLAALEKRLAAEDPALAAVAPGAEIPALEAAVRRFQAANGLEVDGVVGRQTIGALNIAAAERLAQIEANMERWRWLPHRFPARYIAVNAASARLKVVENGKTVLTSRVIVGKRKTPSAIFNAEAVAITVNPPWNVPSSIVRNEILPKLRRNPGYLARHHMVMANGQVRQLPGADNALGYLKVEMPNAFTAYLHDTASRSLFARDQRHLSHGCIRVQSIQPLASWLLTDDTVKGMERIQAEIAAGQTHKIALDRTVPVYVLYWTAVAEPDGSVRFWPDVYGRDKRLIAALAGQPKADAASLGVRTGTGCKS